LAIHARAIDTGFRAVAKAGYPCVPSSAIALNAIGGDIELIAGTTCCADNAWSIRTSLTGNAPCPCFSTSATDPKLQARDFRTRLDVSTICLEPNNGGAEGGPLIIASHKLSSFDAIDHLLIVTYLETFITQMSETINQIFMITPCAPPGIARVSIKISSKYIIPAKHCA
jgi:hypothetical protein